jgi:hypothetical protein
MMIETVTARMTGILVAGAFALTGQGALSGDTNAVRSEPEELIVTAQRPEMEISDSPIETSIQDQIEALDLRFATDLKKDLATIGGSRIELAISEVPKRG